MYVGLHHPRLHLENEEMIIMAEYVEIEIEEMDLFLGEEGFERIEPDAVGHPCKEAVYERSYDDSGCRIRIYSSVDIRNSAGRKAGSDAIRVVLVDPEGYPWNKSFKRVHRVVNWRNNLLQRINPVIDEYWKYPWQAPRECPKCQGGILRTRWGKKGPFMGCSNYNPTVRDSCRNTEAVQ